MIIVRETGLDNKLKTTWHENYKMFLRPQKVFEKAFSDAGLEFKIK